MCTDYTPTKHNDWLKDHFGTRLPDDYPEESYPGFLAPVVIQSHHSGRVACGLARFGLIPVWAKDDKIRRYTYDARSKTVEEKPSYRNAWRKRQFCIVVATFFCWLYKEYFSACFGINSGSRQVRTFMNCSLRRLKKQGFLEDCRYLKLCALKNIF